VVSSVGAGGTVVVEVSVVLGVGVGVAPHVGRLAGAAGFLRLGALVVALRVVALGVLVFLTGVFAEGTVQSIRVVRAPLIVVGGFGVVAARVVLGVGIGVVTVVGSGAGARLADLYGVGVRVVFAVVPIHRHRRLPARRFRPGLAGSDPGYGPFPVSEGGRQGGGVPPPP